MILDVQGYITRKTSHKNVRDQADCYRNWWLVKNNGKGGYVPLRPLYLPKEYVGKKVRFKIEVMENK